MILCYRSCFFHSMSYFQNFSMLLNFASNCGIKCNHMFSSNTLICSPSDDHLDFFQLLLPKTTLHISPYGPAWSSLIHRAYSCLSLINATECSPGWMNLISLPTKNEATHLLFHIYLKENGLNLDQVVAVRMMRKQIMDMF